MPEHIRAATTSSIAIVKAITTRRAISLPETPAAFNRSTSRTRRIAILSAGIVSSRGKSQESRPLGAPAEAPLTERLHPGMAGEIISERRARSNQSGGRHHPGIPGDFSQNQNSRRSLDGNTSLRLPTTSDCRRHALPQGGNRQNMALLDLENPGNIGLLSTSIRQIPSALRRSGILWIIT